MRRREFIHLLGAALAATPSGLLAQTRRSRRIGVLFSQAEGSEEGKDRIGALRDGLQKLGWVEGRNIQIDAHYAASDVERMLALATATRTIKPGYADCFGHVFIVGPAKGDCHHSYCVRAGERPGGSRIREEPGAARRKHYRLHAT